jgi:hypothetical protein
MNTTPPVIFDTNGLDQGTAQTMAQIVANDEKANIPFHITGQNSTSIATAAAAINGAVVTTQQNSDNSPLLTGALAIAQGLTNPIGAATTAVQTGAAKNTVVAGQTWLEAHLANYGLVALGAVLGLGALLIANRETVIKIGKTAAETAAVAA